MKNYVNWNPFEQLRPLTAGLDDIQKKKFVVPTWMSQEKAASFYRWQPHIELKESSEDYVMEIIFEDVEKEHVHLSTGVDQLTVTAKRFLPVDGNSYLKTKQKPKEQNYEKRFPLPSFIDREKISARFEKGRLKVVLPKVNEEEKEIEIE